MTNAKSRLFAAVAGALSLGATAAWAQPSAQDVKIQELQNKVEALEARQAATTKDLAATIDSILRDAEKRSQLLATNGEASAGYDGGFFIKAGDAWVLRPGAFFQFRNVTSYREDAKPTEDDAWDNGFEMRRMRFFLAGNAFSKDLDYYIEWDTNRDSGNLVLFEAWARYFFAEDWGLRVGQFKDLSTHEWITSSKRQLVADFSLVDSLLGGSGMGMYTQGVTLIYGGQRNRAVNIEAGYIDGANQSNTDFTSRGEPLPLSEPAVGYLSSPPKHAFDWGVTGRAEWKAMGDWNDYRDFTAKGTTKDLLVLGIGGDWSQGGDGNLGIFSADAQYEHPKGLGLYAAGLVKFMDGELSGMPKDTTDWGFLVQGSYLLNGNWEIFARYDVTFLDVDVLAADGHTQDDFHEITVGVNYYLGQGGSAFHRAKITVDLTYLPNGAPTEVRGIDVLDNNGFEAEWMLRAQFQLLI